MGRPSLICDLIYPEILLLLLVLIYPGILLALIYLVATGAELRLIQLGPAPLPSSLLTSNNGRRYHLNHQTLPPSKTSFPVHRYLNYNE